MAAIEMFHELVPARASVLSVQAQIVGADMRYWFDTEFIEDGRTIDLLSIGIVAQDGREFYATNADADRSKASAWVQENVIPHLDGVPAGRHVSVRMNLPHHDIATEIMEFIGTGKPEFWAYYADYDWVVLCQSFGTMMQLPKGWPMYCRDVKQLCDMLGNPKMPEQGKGEHHALADARWTKEAWHFLFAEWERQYNESPTL